MNASPGSPFDSAVTPDKIEAVVARLAAFAHPSRIVIFGSAARGELREGSDLDLIVVMPAAVPDWRQESARLRGHVRDIGMPMDILVISEEEARRAEAHPRSMIGESLRTGRLAYQAQP